MADGHRERVNDRRAYNGELALVHLGGRLWRSWIALHGWGAAWYYVNRKGRGCSHNGRGLARVTVTGPAEAASGGRGEGTDLPRSAK